MLDGQYPMPHAQSCLDRLLALLENVKKEIRQLSWGGALCDRAPDSHDMKVQEANKIRSEDE